MSERLPAHLEVASLLRRAEAVGGFGMVLRKGDPDRGAILVVAMARGTPEWVVERELSPDFTYRWTAKSAAECDVPNLLRDRRRIDPDCWQIELDVPDAQRFVAEMTDLG